MNHVERLQRRADNSRQRGGHDIRMSLREVDELLAEIRQLKNAVPKEDDGPIEIELIGEPF